MTRLKILQKSLAKKQQLKREKLDAHFADVKMANGQPLNDKRNGIATRNRWDKQSESISELVKSIKVTERAIAKQQRRSGGLKDSYNKMPNYLQALIDDGTLKQWARFPHIMFVNGVNGGRLVFNAKSCMVAVSHLSSVPNDEYATFRDVFNKINDIQNTAAVI